LIAISSAPEQPLAGDAATRQGVDHRIGAKLGCQLKRAWHQVADDDIGAARLGQHHLA
jgi:hypothetical protein